MSDPLWPSVLPGARWYPAHRADHRALALYKRHYSAKRYTDGRPRRQFVEPGACQVLLTPGCDALFVWWRGLRHDGRQGVWCSCFRNESPYRSSELLREAEQLAWARWPGAPLYTYVDASRVRSATPGYCFLAARWKRLGESKGGLLLFGKRPRGAR